MRIHLVGLPHTETTTQYDWCAYTAKVRKFADMMSTEGHEVFLYAGEVNDAKCAEHITLVTRDEQATWWPDWDPEYDYWPDGWRTDATWWTTMNRRAILEIKARAEHDDIIGLIAGLCQKPIADAFPAMSSVEWGIGYQGTFSKYRVFESHAWMHHILGRTQENLGHFYDRVIPNSFEQETLPYSPNHDDYLLYLGRMIHNKGLQIVRDVAEATGFPVVTAGQGDERIEGAEHRGIVRGREKAELFGRARACLVPTLYIEPFGGVAVEAQMTGTPVITTDWGAFPETVVQGVTGFRCNTLQEFVDASQAVWDLDRAMIAERARNLYSLEAVAPQYTRYLEQVQQVWTDGWYTLDRG